MGASQTGVSQRIIRIARDGLLVECDCFRNIVPGPLSQSDLPL